MENGASSNTSVSEASPPSKKLADFQISSPSSETHSSSQYPDLPPKYQLLEVLGEGAFSKVYKGMNKITQEVVAIKIINKENLSAKQAANIKNEINVLSKVHHKNVLRLIELYNEPNTKHCYIILEYCDGGEIFNKIIEYTYFSEDLSRHTFTQLLSAIDYLHNKAGIVHRDIKPENLIFKKIPMKPRSEEEFKKTLRKSDDESKSDEGIFEPGKGGGTIGVIKLADFGLAKQLKTDRSRFNAIDTNLKTPCGTAGYTAPEVITCNTDDLGRKHRKFPNNISKKNYYSKAVDIWSLGCFLYTILCGFPPFYEDDHDNLTKKIVNGDYVFLKPWWDEISSEAKHLITRMLDVNPESRITIDEIWAHPWVKNDVNETLVAPESYFAEADDYSVSHIENVIPEKSEQKEGHMMVPSSKDPLLSPRANAIKTVFNNPAMGNSKSILKKYGVTNSSVQFIDGVTDDIRYLKVSPTNKISSSSDNDSYLSDSTRRILPKSPVPSNELIGKLGFKDVFVQTPTQMTVHEEHASDDDDDSSNDDEDDEGDETYDNDVASLEHFEIKKITSSSTNSSEASFKEGSEEYQTRSSSIISGINGDYKFTLNLNDSNLLMRRRSSTVRSSKSGGHGRSSLSHHPPELTQEQH